jgi:hypothetical protein
MDFESYKKDLLAEQFDEGVVENILDTYYHSGTSHVFQGDAAVEAQFKRSLANKIGGAFKLPCHPRHLVVCGSAHLGFSAAPNEKFGWPFDFTDSDIDVAILLPELFDHWWLELVNPKIVLGERRIEIADDLLNGFISPQFVRDSTITGQRWWELFGTFDAAGYN